MGDRAVPAFPPTFHAFLDAWYGPVDDGVAMAASPLPGPLEEWRRQQLGRRRPIAVQNQVVLDERPDLVFGRRPVYVEDQAVWLWGVDPDDPEGEVSERPNDASGEWTGTGEPLCDFLLHVAVLEAVMGAPALVRLDSATASVLGSVTSTLEPAPVRPWRWPGPEHRLWYGENVVAFSCANPGPEGHTVFIGARTDAALAPFVRLTRDPAT
jgi:hypothetical protein